MRLNEIHYRWEEKETIFFSSSKQLNTPYVVANFINESAKIGGVQRSSECVPNSGYNSL